MPGTTPKARTTAAPDSPWSLADFNQELYSDPDPDHTSNADFDLVGQLVHDADYPALPAGPRSQPPDSARSARRSASRRTRREAKKARLRHLGDNPQWPALSREPTEQDAARFAAAWELARTIDLAPADPAGLPPMATLPLASTRRAAEGRGGATSISVTMRTAIRSPYLPVLAAIFGDPNKTGGRPGVAAQYWFFYAMIARELGSNEWAEQEIRDHYDSIVRPEFAAIGVTLPAVPAKGKHPGYFGFRRWRDHHVVRPRRLGPLNSLFTVLSLRLHVAIAAARGAAPGTLLNPAGYQYLISDSSVFKGPSSTFAYCPLCGIDADLSACPHPSDLRVANRTKAKAGNKPRVHRPGKDFRGSKHHGCTEGFHNIAVLGKNDGSYARTVLAVDVDGDGRDEMNVSMPLLAPVLELAGTGWVRAIAYDGLLMPVHHLELLQRYGVPVINLVATKGTDAKAVTDPLTPGQTVRERGKHKGKPITTYASAQGVISHPARAGGMCHHHLIADDGALYTSSVPVTFSAGKAHPGSRRGTLLRPIAMDRIQTDHHTWQVILTFEVPCPEGDLTAEFVLTDSRRVGGSVAMSEPIAAVRHVSEADRARISSMAGIRNNVESFFDWLEKRYHRKDRFASWGRDSQLLDLMCAGMLCNSEVWASNLTSLRAPA